MNEPLDREALAAEVASGNFSDPRLTKRLETIVRGLGRDPAASLPKVFDSADLEGAYRFFSNVAVTPEDILAGHFAATKARCSDEQSVRIVHDTSEFSYRPDGKRQGLGNRSYQSFCGHFSLAITSDSFRKPLGLAGLHTWVRGETKETEHSLWLKQIKASEAMLGCGAKAIHLFDRAADDYELFYELGDRHRFVTRVSVDRWTESGPDSTRAKLREVMATVEQIGERDATINGRKRHASAHRRKIHPPREPRDVKLHIAAATVELVRPAAYGKTNNSSHNVSKAHLGHLPMTLSINVVRVWEPEPPEGAEPIEWLLYTNEPIGTIEEVCAVVEHYRARWTIEEYFKALKTGCAFERRQLEEYESLINALATFVPLAYQILLLRTVARSTPDAPASAVASKDQIDVLRALGRRKLSEHPTARDILLAIAALGGHIKYAPDPGWLTIARGYEELDSMTAGWRAAKLQSARDQS